MEKTFRRYKIQISQEEIKNGNGKMFSLKPREDAALSAHLGGAIPIVINATNIAAQIYSTQSLDQYRIAISSKTAATVQMIAMVPIAAIR